MTLENENLCSHKNLHTKVYGNSIHNCKKLETTQMSFDSQMDKQNVVLLCNRILFSNKKNKPLDTHDNLDESQRHTEYKQPVSMVTYIVITFKRNDKKTKL